MYISDPSWLSASEAIYQKQRDLLSTDPEHIKEKKQLMAVAKEFEAIFYHQLYKSMRQTVPRSGFIDGGFGEEVFEDLLDYELARITAEQAVGGLAHMIYEQFSPSLSPSEEPSPTTEAIPLKED